MALVMVTTTLPTMALATAEGGSTNPPTPAATETPEASEDGGNTESVYNNEEDSQPQGLMRAPMLTAEADDKRAYYQIIMEDGTAIKLYPGMTGGHCIRTNSSTEAESGGDNPNGYVVKLVGKRVAGSTRYDYSLYLKNFRGQSITYCDGETGVPYNRDYLYIEVEGDNYLTAGTASLRDGVYTAIGRTILKGNQDITYRISNNHPERGSLTIKAVNGDVSGMKKAYGIACQNLNLSGSATQSGGTIQSSSFVLNITLSGNETGGDRAITVTNRFMIEYYASMFLNVQGLNAVYNESKFDGNHTTNPPNDEDKYTYFLINTAGNVNIILDTMELDGRVSAFYNNYYQDNNYPDSKDGVNELRKVGNMEITVKNLHPSQLKRIRANPTGYWDFDTLPAWEKEGGYGITLKELQSDNTCVFKFEKNQVNIANLMIYDGAIGGSDYSLRAYKDCASTGTTIYAPITAPKISSGIPFKCWTTVDGAPLNFTSADGATNGDLAVLLLEPKSTTKLLAMYDPFTSQPKWQPVYNSTHNYYDGKISWTAAYGMANAAGWLVPENYKLDESLKPVAVIDSKGRDVWQVDSGVSRFSIEDGKCDYSVPEGRYRIALKNGSDGRWHYSEPFNISYALVEPQISPEGGFPDGDKVSVTISSAAGAEIWYTVIDDRTPTMPDVQRYAGPLEIPVTADRGTVVVEAYAIKEGKKSAWATAKFSTKPAAPTVKLPDGTTAKSGTTYIYYDAADISAVVPDGVEVRYGAAPPSNGAPGTKLGKGETFTVSNGNGHLQTTYLCARKTIRSGNRTYTAWSEPFSLVLARVGDLPDPIVKVGGKVMENGSTYTVDGSAEVTLTRPEYCPVDAKLVYTKDSAIPSHCVEYTKPITISNQATKLDVYMRAWNSETNKYDASPGGIYHFQIKPGTTAWRLFLTDAKAYDSRGNVIEKAISGTVVTVRANPYSESEYGVFNSWEGTGTQYLKNEKVDTYQPEVTFVMPDNAVILRAKYSTNSTEVQEAMKKTRLIVDMGGATNVGESIYLAVPQYRGISYSWWEGDKIGTKAQELPPYASFDPSKTYTVKVTITANDGLRFPSDPEVTAAKWLWKDKDLEFAITRDKLTVDAEKKTITFELHLFKQLALTLPTLHPGDKIPTTSEVGGVPSGMYASGVSWREPKPSGYAGAAGTEYTILELALKTDGDCLPMIPTVTDTTADPVSCTVNGKPYTCTIIADRGLVCIKDVKVPVVPEGVSVSGTVKSYNPGNATTIQLMQGGAEQYSTTIDPTTGSGQKEQSFRFDTVAAGTYDLVVTKDGHLSYTVKNVEGGDTALDLTTMTGKPYQTITLLAGDVNGDGKINNLDYAVVLNPLNFNKNYTNPSDVDNVLADINGDGKINNLDYALILMPAHFNKTTSACIVAY